MTFWDPDKLDLDDEINQDILARSRAIGAEVNGGYRIEGLTNEKDFSKEATWSANRLMP